MRGRSILCAFGLITPLLAQAQAPQKKDSLAKADSAARADSIALVHELEKELGKPAGDSGAAAQTPPHASGGYMNIGFVSLTDAGWSTEPDIGSLERGDHDPQVRGFTIPNTELALDGAVDPYFKGFSNIVFKLDKNGETGVELEEAFVLTTSLPANLQLKAGQFFTEFGRQNPQHPHSWAFVDQPLVLNRMFGPDGLRSQGLRVSWLAPTPFYTEALLSIVNSAGGATSSFRSEESPEIHGGRATERAVRGLQDMLIVPRLATSFDLTETQTLLLGASAAFGPNNSGSSARTRIYGVDGYWKWKPAAAQQGFPFISMQGEALLRRYDAAERVSADVPTVTLPNETLKDRGAYAQVLWGIKPRIVAGLRGDWARGDDASFDSELRADRFRVSPNFTWYPTEFSKFRVQYNYDDRKEIGSDHSLWFQFEFLLGAHASHKF
ncbi:MAG: hypothetical protein Q7S20_09065 [Gemmatimonadaceae bacterium]|nr:hypothetical protein [Gemmatimonadaceae bacterium]